MDNKDLQALNELLDKKLGPIQSNIKDLKEGQNRIEKKLDSVYNQTADLTEFKTEVISRLEELKEIKAVTRENCYDIAKLKSIK